MRLGGRTTQTGGGGVECPSKADQMAALERGGAAGDVVSQPAGAVTLQVRPA